MTAPTHDSATAPSLDRTPQPTRLRLQVTLVVIGAVAALLLFLASATTSRIDAAYNDAARARTDAVTDGVGREMTARASTLGDIGKGATGGLLAGASVSDLRDGWPALRSASFLVRSKGQYLPVLTTEAAASPTGSAIAPPPTGQVETFRLATSGDNRIATVVRPTTIGTAAGLLVVKVDTADLQERQAAATRKLRGLEAMAGGAFSLLVIVLLALLVFRPLGAIAAAAAQVLGGARGVRVDWSRSDEIGSIAMSIDRLAQGIEDAEEELARYSIKDGVTGLLKERAFAERLGEELARSRREEYPVAFVTLEVDGLRGIVEGHGQATADEVLRQVGQEVAASLRPSDICGRDDDDTLVLALVKADNAAALTALRRLRARLVGMTVDGVDVQVNAGLADYPDTAADPMELERRARAALLWARRRGAGNAGYCISDGFELLRDDAQPTSDQEAA